MFREFLLNSVLYERIYFRGNGPYSHFLLFARKTILLTSRKLRRLSLSHPFFINIATLRPSNFSAPLELWHQTHFISHRLPAICRFRLQIPYPAAASMPHNSRQTISSRQELSICRLSFSYHNYAGHLRLHTLINQHTGY